MSSYRLITDSSADLNQQIVDEIDVDVLPLIVHAEGKEYRDYPDNRDISPSEYYRMLREGIRSSTSAVNVNDFIDFFEPVLSSGQDILYLAFSSGLSATYNASVMAAKELKAKFPARKIYCVDTLCASMGQGLLVYLTSKVKNSGKTIEETRDYAESIKMNLCHQFTVEDLNFLHKGGRVSKSTAVIGSALNIKPVMHVDNDGHLTKTGTARGRKGSIKALFENMKKLATDTETVFISHGDCIGDAEYLAAMIREQFDVKDLRINFVGPVIGTHSGPGTLALFFIGKER